ncbi:MAG: 50S ribosomal protein L35 [Candidatus Omnitrophica bacterium]|nr:50S ribosomal protein L35 [Candidatus Omnitrophota bacterium]
MAKLKTNKSVKKRFRVTKSGKIKRMRAGKRHLLQHKSSKRKRHLRGSLLVPGGEMQNTIRRLLPYA